MLTKKKECILLLSSDTLTENENRICFEIIQYEMYKIQTAIKKEYSIRVARCLVLMGLCCPQCCLSFSVTHVSGCEGTHLSHSQGLLLQITTSICTLTLNGARSQSRCKPVCPAPSERGSVSKSSPRILHLKPPWTRR